MDKIKKEIDPLWVIIIISLISLVVAYITFGILNSTGAIQDERLRLGGAAVGFFVFFSMIYKSYSSQMDKLRDEKIKKLEDELKENKQSRLNMLIVLDPKSPRASEAKFAECSYEIMDMKGEILDKHEKIRIAKDTLSHHWKFFIPLPSNIKYEHLTTIIIKDDKGIEYHVTDYIFQRTLELDGK